MVASSFKKLSVLLSIFPLASFAKLNDWSKPCLQGECAYDLPQEQGSGSLKIWGSADVISDITEAAGWAIIGCDAKAIKQNIRLVCLDASVCGHLYQSRGPVNKIVRLPENCGKNAFARIAKEWVSDDQTIPESVAKRLPNGKTLPKVKALTLDTDFSQVDPSETGPVSFSLRGTTIPGFEWKSEIAQPVASPSKRGFWDWWDDLNEFDKDISKNLPPIDISKDYPIFSQSFTCTGNPSFSASISATANVNAHAQLAIGAAASGTFIPPHFDEFGVYLGIYSASVQGILDVKASVAGSADSGLITLFQQGIPGLSFAGILSIGPVFKVMAQATASLDLNVDLAVDLSYSVQNAKLFFPPSGAPASGGNFNPTGNPIKLSVTPSIVGNAGVTASVIPRVDVGIDALGVVSANVYVDLAASANLHANLAVSAANSASGCVNAGLELNAHAGANANFFGLFDPSTSVSLFDKQFPLLNKCFGTSAAASSTPNPVFSIHPTLTKFPITSLPTFTGFPIFSDRPTLTNLPIITAQPSLTRLPVLSTPIKGLGELHRRSWSCPSSPPSNLVPLA